MQGIDDMILGLIFTRCQFSGDIVKDSKMRSERSADAEFRRLLYKIVLTILSDFLLSLFMSLVFQDILLLLDRTAKSNRTVQDEKGGKVP